MRHILLILTLIVLTAATGCRMCAHPYDDCGPTYVGDCSVSCDPLARAGSVLSPPLSPMGAPAGAVVDASAEESSVPLKDAQPSADGSAVPLDGTTMPAEGDALLEPIPAGPDVSDAPKTEANRVVRLPAPPVTGQDRGPTFLR